MKEYLISVLIVSVCVGIFDVLKGSASNKSVHRNLQLIASLCVISVIIWPFSSLSSSGTPGGILNSIRNDLSNILQAEKKGDSKEELEIIYLDNLSELTRNTVADRLKELLCDKYGIERQNIVVTVESEVSESEIQRIKSVSVTLKNNSIWENPYVIEKYVSDLLDCDCKVKSSN